MLFQLNMELVICKIVVLVSLVCGLCWAQGLQPSTNGGCVINTCSYARDTRAMDCESRQLVCVPSNTLYKSSDSIKLGQNTITRIKQNSFSGYTRLTQLDISNNLISVLDPLAFHTVSSLQTLLINFNQITQIGATAFSSLRKLIVLQLQGNIINSIHQNAFNDLVGIRELNLAGNRLTNLPDGVFAAMSAMQMLFLQENQLVLSANSQFLRGLRGLQDIDLDGNRFSAIPRLDDLSRLTALDMTDSHVTIISNNTFQNTATLRDVVLSGNIISTIEPLAFNGLGNAVELDLSNNAIADIPFGALSPLRNLETLLLQSNLMTVLRSEHFVHLASLRTLNIEGNQIKRLPLMASLHSLTLLNAKANLLETFDQETLSSLPRMNKLQLTGNRLQCDCRLKALQQWYITSGPAHHPHEIPQCSAAQPVALRGRRITTLSQGDFVCETPTIQSVVRQVHKTAGSSLQLSCIANGFPDPQITWMAPGGFVYTFGPSNRIMVTENGELLFKTIENRDQGEYTCIGINPAGRASATITLRVTPIRNPPNPPKNPPAVPPKPPAVLTTTQPPNVLPNNVTTLPAGAHPVTANPGTNGRTEIVTVVTEKSQTVSDTVKEITEIDPGSNRNHSNADQDKDSKSTESGPFLGSDLTPSSTQSSLARNDGNDVASVCFIGYTLGGLLVAMLCTCLLTMACVIALFIAWRKGLLPSQMKTVNEQKARLVNMICRRESVGEECPTPPSSISYGNRSEIHPPSTIRSGRPSYDRMEDSSLGSSYSFSEVSTESVSVSSREETARYVTTESVIDPVNMRMRQQRLAAIANSVAHSSLSDSEMSNSSYLSRHDPSQRRVYANAAMVEQDPNYTSLWRQGDSNPPAKYERARKVDSRIYIDVR